MDIKKIAKNIEFYGLLTGIILVGGNLAYKKIAAADKPDLLEQMRQDATENIVPVIIPVDLHKAFLLDIRDNGREITITSPHDLSLMERNDSLIMELRTVDDETQNTNRSTVIIGHNDASRTYWRNMHDLGAAPTGIPYVDTVNLFVPLSQKTDTIRFFQIQ